MTKAMTIIRAEHRAIGAVLKGLLGVVAEIEAGNREPDFRLIDAMVHYIEAMPETLHHPKEDEYLYAALADRTEDQKPLLDEIHAEHGAGREIGRDLIASLLAYRVQGASALAPFAAAVRAYTELQWTHMRKEEEILLPLAERLLSASDWAAVDAAFEANDEARLEPEKRKAFRELFRRLAALTPAPFGLGD
ncbi:MAG: hemerythrin domain-containing protein [Phyllobacteriaceae bacterium]|nr:hemerythrin domain-containing protein [Phyllobacteriaceae bacterium]